MTWAWILGSAAVCYATKLAGLSVPRRVLEDHRVSRAGQLLPVALLSALIATQTFSTGHHLVLDSRAAGLGAATVAQALRAPFIVVVVVACVVAALVRAAT